MENGAPRMEAFTSLAGFLERHPGNKKKIITHYLSRKKTPFSDNEITVIRLPVFAKRNPGTAGTS